MPESKRQVVAVPVSATSNEPTGAHALIHPPLSAERAVVSRTDRKQRSFVAEAARVRARLALPRAWAEASFVYFDDGVFFCGDDYPGARLGPDGDFEVELDVDDYELHLLVQGTGGCALTLSEPITVAAGESTWELDESWTYVDVFGKAGTHVSVERDDRKRRMGAGGTIPATGHLVLLFCAGEARLYARAHGKTLLERDLQLLPDDRIEIHVP